MNRDDYAPNGCFDLAKWKARMEELERALGISCYVSWNYVPDSFTMLDDPQGPSQP